MKKIIFILMLVFLIISNRAFSDEYKDLVVEKATNKIKEIRCNGNSELLKQQYGTIDYDIISKKITDAELDLIENDFKYLMYNLDNIELNQPQKDADSLQKALDAKDVTKVNKLIKAALLVLAEYAGKTPAQFKNDVQVKYDLL